MHGPFSTIKSRGSKQTGTNKWLTRAPIAAWCLLIATLSSVPGDQYPQVQWQFADEAVHIALYFWIGVFGYIYFTTRSYGVFATLIFGILYGLSDEIHQLFVPRRTFSLTDWAADSVGVTLGVFAICLFFAFTRRRSRQQLSTTLEPDERMEIS